METLIHSLSEAFELTAGSWGQQICPSREFNQRVSLWLMSNNSNDNRRINDYIHPELPFDDELYNCTSLR